MVTEAQAQLGLAVSGGETHRSPVEVEEICSKAAQLRAQRLPMREIAQQLNIPLRSLERHFSNWCKDNVERMKEQWQQHLQSYVETQETVIQQALEDKNLQLANTANNCLLKRLMEVGIIPSQEAKNISDQDYSYLWNEDQRKEFLRRRFAGMAKASVA